jgi:hypothetical protein
VEREARGEVWEARCVGRTGEREFWSERECEGRAGQGGTSKVQGGSKHSRGGEKEGRYILEYSICVCAREGSGVRQGIQ